MSKNHSMIMMFLPHLWTCQWSCNWGSEIAIKG